MSEMSANQAAKQSRVTVPALLGWIKHDGLKADAILEDGSRVPAEHALASGIKVLQWRIKSEDLEFYQKEKQSVREWNALSSAQKAEAVRLYQQRANSV